MAKLISSWSNNLETIPTNYIMPPERRPGNFLPVSTDIPVIDLSLTENQDRRPDLVLQILKAGNEFGLFQVINHGVSEETIQDAKSLYKELFNMNIEDKARLYSEDFTKTCRLYTSRSESNKIDSNHWRDTLQHQCYPLEQHISSWPEKPAQYRKVAGRYAVEVRKLGLRILDLIGEGLGIQQGYFEGGSGLTERQTMSINYYPPCPDPSLAMGIAAHSDPNLITLLHQDVAGLQVLKDEQWVGVEALPNAFVVNGGCQLQIISNGKFKSAEHRGVTNSMAARTSIVTFLGPSNSAVVQPAEEIVTSSDPPKFKALVYAEFMGTYFAYYSKKVPRLGTSLDPYKL